jgi:ubiquinone/menaquinone biosynthesis C-methylase UbiE
MVIADIGSGTGILSELFLKNGNLVFGVEPNQEMRQAAETLLSHYPNFTSIDGRAEATLLPDKSVDLVAAGQAFHWFDPQKAKVEFRRILRPGSLAMFVWNGQKVDGSPFMRAYKQLVAEYRIDDRAFESKQDNGDVAQFFAEKVEMRTFDNEQSFNFTGLKGRHLSSSFIPLAGHPQYEPMMRDLRRLFDTFQKNGQIRFLYTTRLYFGPVG